MLLSEFEQVGVPGCHLLSLPFHLLLPGGHLFRTLVVGQPLSLSQLRLIALQMILKALQLTDLFGAVLPPLFQEPQPRGVGLLILKHLSNVCL